jgi:hypothetical protein
MYPSPPGSGRRRPAGIGQPSGPGRPERKPGTGRRSRKGFWVAVAIILCAAAAAAAVFFWYLPSRDGSAGADSVARMLVLEAQTAIERAYTDTGTFDPSVMDRTVLSDLAPAISFNPLVDTSAATAPLAQAAAASVNYSGTETTYAVGTMSESGTSYGLIVDKQADTTTYYTSGQPVQSWNQQAGTATSVAPVPTTQATGPVSSAADIAAQMLIRNAITALESAYAQLQSFSPEVLTPAVLAGIEPSIAFVPADGETAATAPVSPAMTNSVDFYGTATSYSLGTVSASGNTFGVRVSKGPGGSISTYYVNGGVEDWSASSQGVIGQTASPPATAPAIMARHQDTGLGCSFDYPASWTDYPAQTLGVPTAGFSSAYAVSDPQGALVSSTPADYILFGGLLQQGALGPQARLDALATSMAPTFLAGATVVEPTTDFEVNGTTAAAKTYRLAVASPQVLSRIVCLVSGERVFYFFFVSEETRWALNKTVFDATLDSFRATVVA